MSPVLGKIRTTFVGGWLYALYTKTEQQRMRKKIYHKILVHAWLSAILDLLFHTCLLALSHSGRHGRTTVQWRTTNDQAGPYPIVELQPDFKTIQVWSKKYEGLYMVTKSTNAKYLHDDQSDPRVAQRVRSKRPDERNNSTSSQRRHQTS